MLPININQTILSVLVHLLLPGNYGQFIVTKLIDQDFTINTDRQSLGICFDLIISHTIHDASRVHINIDIFG